MLKKSRMSSNFADRSTDYGVSFPWACNSMLLELEIVLHHTLFGAVTRIIHPFGHIYVFCDLGDIFENFIMDTGSSPKLYRHQLLGHLQKIIGNVEDRLRRSFEVSRVLVNNCTCCMTKQRLAILSMSLHKRDRSYGKIKTSLMLIWVNKWKLEAVIAYCNWVLRSLIYPDNIIGIGSNSFWNLHLGFGLCGLVI